VAANPEHAEALNNRGIAHHARDDRQAALADFDRALEIRPRYAECLVNRATTRQIVGDLAGAVADFDRAIGIRPGYADAYFGRAGVLAAQGDLAGALADYDQVLRLIPPAAAAPVYHLRGGIRFRQRRFAEALLDFDTALKIQPGLCMAYISRGNVRYHLRDLAGAADYFTAFQLDAPATAAEIIRLVVLDLREDVEGVLENCRKHLRISPDDAIAYVRRGLTLLLLGWEPEGLADFEQCLHRHPDWKEQISMLVATARQQVEAVRGLSSERPTPSPG